MILHHSRGPNPRLALTLARHLEAPLRLVFAEPFAQGQAETCRARNPSWLVPILEKAGQPPM